jgi:aminobenzoyl-glutamate utilization protein B
MHLASKVLATTAVDLFTDPALVEGARLEFEERRGPDFTYESLVGDRAPPLDYRK